MTTLPRPALVGLRRRLRHWRRAVGPRRLPYRVARVLAGSVVAGLVVATIAFGRGAPPREVGLLLVAHDPTVVRLQGTIRLWQPPTGWVFVEGGATLWPGDRLLTDAESRAALTWPSGVSASLDSAASLTIGSPAADGTVRVELTEGALWLDGGHEPDSPRVEVVTRDGVRVSGARFDARRDAGGRLIVTSADVPVEVWARDARRDLPPASVSEVLAGQRPTLARPAMAPPALAVTVDGPPAWVVVDPLGRVVGAPPGGGPWLDQVPAVRGPLPRRDGAGVLVPEPRGEYRLMLWAGDSPRQYRVAAWSTSGQAVFGGVPPAEEITAARTEGTIHAGGATTLVLTAEPRAVTFRGGAQLVTGLPSWLRLAAAPDLSTTRIASSPPAREAEVTKPREIAPGEVPAEFVGVVQAGPASALEPPITIVVPVMAANAPPSVDEGQIAEAAGAGDESASETEPPDPTLVAGDTATAAASDPAPESTDRGPSASFGGPLPDMRAAVGSPATASGVQPRSPSATPIPTATRDPETLPRVAAPALVGTTTISSGNADRAAGFPGGTPTPLMQAAIPTPSPADAGRFPTPAIASPTPALPSVRLPTTVLPIGTRALPSITLGGFATVAVPATPVPGRAAQPAASSAPLAPAAAVPGAPLAPAVPASSSRR